MCEAVPLKLQMRPPPTAQRQMSARVVVAVVNPVLLMLGTLSSLLVRARACVCVRVRVRVCLLVCLLVAGVLHLVKNL